MTPPTVMHWPASSGGGGSWTPSSVASLAHWYDASLETGSNGSSITTAIDQAGSTNLTASAGVSLVTNWSNGLAGYDFDGTDNNTLGATSVTTLSGATDAWVFMVHDCQNAAANPFVLHYSDTSAAGVLFSIQARSTSILWFRVQGSALANTGAGSSASGKTIVGMRTDGTTLHAYQDGSALTLGNSAITSGFPVQTAALMSLGNDNTGNKMDGVIGEAIVGNGTLSDADREKLEGYLAHKWGLTANLPASHPYKSTAP